MSKTISQVILEKKLMRQYGEQINELKEKVIKAIDERITGLENRIVNYVKMKNVESAQNLAQIIDSLNELKYKAKINILSLTEEDLESIGNIESSFSFKEFINSLGNADEVIVLEKYKWNSTDENLITKLINEHWDKVKTEIVENGDTKCRSYRCVEGNSPKEISINVTVNGDSTKAAKDLFKHIEKKIRELNGDM